MARVTPKQAEKLLLELRESNDRGAIHWFSPPEPDPEQWPPGAELAPEILRAFWRDVSLGDEVDIPGALRPQAALAAETSAAHGPPEEASGSFPGGWRLMDQLDGSAFAIDANEALWRLPGEKDRRAGRTPAQLTKKSGKPLGLVEWLRGRVAEALSLVPDRVAADAEELRVIAPIRRLPEAWLLADGLKSLVLGATRLRELPARLGELTELRQLVIDAPLEALPPELARATRLETLKLTNTRLEALPEWLGEFEELQVLEVQSGPLRELPEALCSSPRLRSLTLNQLALERLPDALGRCSALQELHLQRLPVSTLPSLADVPLTRVVLSSLELSAVPPLPTSLSQLELSELPLDEPALDRVLSPLERLQTLVLRGLKPELVRLPRLPALETLRLYACGLRDLPREVAQLSALRTLCLDQNPLTSLPDWVFELPNLERLYLYHTPFREEQIQSYRASHAALKIQWLAPLGDGA
ncbi:MAG: hypothetical protein R3B89_16515 [Polyangiaceae bacterium]